MSELREQIEITRTEVFPGVAQVYVSLDGRRHSAGFILELIDGWAWATRPVMSESVIDSGKKTLKDDATRRCAAAFVKWARGGVS